MPIQGLLDASEPLSVDFATDIRSTTRPSKTDPNVANRIDHWLRSNYPELVDIAGLWFTGSQVWKHLYGEPIDFDADLDIIAETDGARQAVREVAAKLAAPPSGKTTTTTSLGGERLYTTRGDIDLWRNDNPILAIRDYPDESHAHARAAYSTRDGVLLVLPNGKARPG